MADYIDSVTDASGFTWFVNDQVTYHLPGVRSDEGKIAVISHPSTTHVMIDFGTFHTVVPFTRLVLRRRRTRDEIPYASGLLD